MIALLPVSRYRVRFQVAAGRPYSFFERLVLEAIAEGQSSLDALALTFRVHRRLLIESVVTLMQAGWVAFDRSTHGLLPTKEGRRAIEQPGELPKSIVVTERTDHLVGERVQGQLARGAEVTFSRKADLRPFWNHAAFIPKGDLPHPLETGIIVPLLRRNEGEWVRSCGPVDIVRDGADYIVVDVDTSAETITGIPSRWVPLLRNELLDRARRKERQLVLSGGLPTDSALARLVRRDVESLDATEAIDADEWLLDSGLDRLIVGSDEHHALLEDRLETARSYVGIVSGNLEALTLERLTKPLLAAVGRGVVVDVAWGTGPEPGHEDDHARCVDLLKKLEWDSRHSSARGRLTVGRAPSRSHAKILLSDATNAFEAIVGSYNWLGGSQQGRLIDLSLVFRETGPAARIARLVTDLAANDERLSTGAGLTRLRHAAAELDRQTAEAGARQLAERKRGGSGPEPVADIQIAPEESPTPDNDRSDGQTPPDAYSVVAVPEPSGNRWRARILVGREHYTILSLLAREARNRLVIACHRWGQDSETAFAPLREALEHGCPRVEIRYGVDLGADDHDALRVGFEKLGGVVRQVPELHAKVAIADDDTAVVTSFDWLCPDLDRARFSASEIGFLLRGAGVGAALLERIGLLPLEAPAAIDAEYVTAFLVERLRSIDRVEWSLQGAVGPGWHVIVGDNGSGKTSVLRALALALVGSEGARGLRQNWSTWLRGSEANARVQVSLERATAPSPVAAPLPSSRTLELTWNRTTEGVTLSESQRAEDAFVSAGYGPFRRFAGGDPEYEKQLAAVPKLARHISLFDERVALTESLGWLRDLRFKALENDAEATLLLDRLTKLVNDCGLLPSGIKLAQVTSDAVLFRDEIDHECSIEDLSDGYRSILSLTFDIVRQLAMAFGPAHVFDLEYTDIVSAPAIVLIDEVDAHLHPSWQRTAGQWFCGHFPRTQFIVTTHSPLVCQAAENGTVFRLPDPADELDSGGMLDGPARARLIYGNVLEAYASGAFGESIARSETAKKRLQRLAELNHKEITAGLSSEEQAEQEELRAALASVAHYTGEDGSR